MFSKNYVRIFPSLESFNNQLKFNQNEQSIYSVRRIKKEEVNLRIKWIEKIKLQNEELGASV